MGEGSRCSELSSKIRDSDLCFNSNTINGSWNLDVAFPEKVCKSSKGRFRLLVFKDQEQEMSSTLTLRPSRNEPGLFFTNKYLVRIEKDLFS